jgi:3D-(3,5/4)-trihydroxycyclohexane-1,2-dione acylhydrolase (decyclizing)
MKLVVVLIDNHGFGSIKALSEALGSQGYGTGFRMRDESGRLSGPELDIDFGANARSLGAIALSASTEDELVSALKEAKASETTVVIHVSVGTEGTFGGSGAWWDVPVSETSTIESTSIASVAYEDARRRQRAYL